MIYDCFTFFNELDLLELRLNTLSEVVDRFVICEATRTYTGKPKKLLFEENRGRFAKFAQKITYIAVDDLLPEEEVVKDLYHLPWVNENRQRNALIRGLENAKDDDIFMVSDLDEIPRPEAVVEAAKLALTGEIIRLELDVFVYYLNFKDYRNPRWNLGTVAVSLKTFRQSKTFDMMKYDRYTVESECQGHVMQKVRFSSPTKTLHHGGWHFTYMGGLEAIRKKVDAFSHQEAKISIKSIEGRLARGENVLTGRRDNFAVPLDESFPKYLLDNRDKYAGYLLPVTDKDLRATLFGRLAATFRGTLYRIIVMLIPKPLHKPLTAIRQRFFFR